MTPSFVQADKPVSSGAFEQTDKGSLWVANSQSGRTCTQVCGGAVVLNHTTVELPSINCIW